jgi:hypothetical protein
MNRLGILILLVALGVQAVSPHSQRWLVDDPVERTHVKVADDFEAQKASGRFKLDLAAVLSLLELPQAESAGIEAGTALSCFLSHRSDAYFQRGPPVR